MLSQDSGEWLTFAEDVAKVQAAAQKLTEEFEKMRIDQLGEMLSQDSGEWLTFAEDVGKVQLEAQKLTEEFEKMRDAQRAAIDSQDSAEWLDAAAGAAKEADRIAAGLGKTWENLAGTISGAIDTMIQGVLMGTQKPEDLAKNFALNLALAIASQANKALFEDIVAPWLKQIFSEIFQSMSSSGSGIDWGGLFSSIIKAIGSVSTYEKGGRIPSWIQSFDSGGAVPILAHAGEFVMRRGAVNNIGAGNMEYMNSTGRMPSGGQSVTVNIVMDYAGAWDPRQLRTSSREVVSFVSDALDGNYSFRRKVAGTR
jgi:hypothetical protein